jgi:hypothetical protein
MLVTIQFRRGTTAEWASANPILGLGEPGLDRTLGQIKLGDGVTHWDSLEWSTFSADQMQQLAELLESGVNVNDGIMTTVLETDASDFTTSLAGSLGVTDNPVGAALSASYAAKGTDAAAFEAALPPGTEFVYFLMDGDGTLIDILSGLSS